MSRIADEFQSKGYLYRYRPIRDDILCAFEMDRLYFSAPEMFNDPYDNLLFANLEKIWSNVYGNILYGMDGYLSRLKERNLHLAFFAYDFWKEEKREESIELFFERICSAVDSVKKNVRHNVKIVCFSEIFDSMLMWSHYADNHKGFVLIFDKTDLKNAERYSITEEQLENKIRLEKVEYVEKQIDLSEDIENYVRSKMPNFDDAVIVPDGTISQHKLREFVIQKSVEWKYEKEWRMIPRIIDLEKQSPLGYVECRPKGIILGTHCDEENSKKIISIAKKKGIPVYRMFLSEFSPEFKLEIGEGENAKII